MSITKQAETEQAETDAWSRDAALAAEREKLEADKMTRRSALRKMGLTSGAVFGMFFAVDDLARLAIKKLEEHRATREIANSVAHDFRNVGIAFGVTGQQLACSGCVAEKYTQYSRCTTSDNNCSYGCTGLVGQAQTDCLSNCNASLSSCNASALSQAAGCCSQYSCNC
jgi:hypothetical protein